ncbi:MAG: GNAT family N-acetyltransferase [Moraxella sp.]
MKPPVDGTTAYISYVDNGDVIVYDHTIVPDAIGGRGIAGALTKHALDYARKQGKSSASLLVCGKLPAKASNTMT